MPRESVTRLVAEPGETGVEAHLRRGRQIDGDILAVYVRCDRCRPFAILRPHLREGVLPEGTRLHDQPSLLFPAAVHELDPHGVGCEMVDEGGDVGR